jgi:hypothetical protein
MIWWSIEIRAKAIQLSLRPSLALGCRARTSVDIEVRAGDPSELREHPVRRITAPSDRPLDLSSWKPWHLKHRRPVIHDGRWSVGKAENKLPIRAERRGHLIDSRIQIIKGRASSELSAVVVSNALVHVVTNPVDCLAKPGTINLNLGRVHMVSPLSTKDVKIGISKMLHAPFVLGDVPLTRADFGVVTDLGHELPQGDVIGSLIPLAADRNGLGIFVGIKQEVEEQRWW